MSCPSVEPFCHQFWVTSVNRGRTVVTGPTPLWDRGGTAAEGSLPWKQGVVGTRIPMLTGPLSWGQPA